MAAAMAAATSSPVSGPGGGDVGDGTGEVRLLQRRHRDRLVRGPAAAQGGRPGEPSETLAPRASGMSPTGVVVLGQGNVSGLAMFELRTDGIDHTRRPPKCRYPHDQRGSRGWLRPAPDPSRGRDRPPPRRRRGVATATKRQVFGRADGDVRETLRSLLQTQRHITVPPRCPTRRSRECSSGRARAAGRPGRVAPRRTRSRTSRSAIRARARLRPGRAARRSRKGPTARR